MEELTIMNRKPRSPTQDITKRDTNLTQGLPQTGELLRKPPPTVMPTAVTNPPSPTQATASFPTSMHPRNPDASSQPVVPQGAAMPSASRTAPPSKAPERGGATPAMTHAEIKQQSRRYGGW
jgi:hypothetical protein